MPPYVCVLLGMLLMRRLYYSKGVSLRKDAATARHLQGF